jgi:hypothetical protein
MTRVLPRPFDALDARADSARDHGRLLIGGALISGVVSAGFEAVPWQSGKYDVSALISAGAFLLALILSSSLAVKRPDQRWHRLRATVEAADGLQWEWASKAGAFAKPALTERDRSRLFEDRLVPLLDDTGYRRIDIDISPSGALCAATDSEQLALYRTERLERQREYYASRECQAVWLGRCWTGISTLAQAGGVTVGVLKGLGELDITLLGFAATVATSAAAWTRARDHANLSAVYAASRKMLSAELVCFNVAGNKRDVITRIERSLSAEHARWLERRNQLGLQVT